MSDELTAPTRRLNYGVDDVPKPFPKPLHFMA